MYYLIENMFKHCIVVNKITGVLFGSQQDDQRHAGRMMLEKIHGSQKCQIGRPLSRIEEDGRNSLRRPKLCIKRCKAQEE